MALLTYYPTEDGIRRLMTALLDLPEYPYRDVPSVALSDAPEGQKVLFNSYVQLIGQALKEAEPWWEGTVAARRAEGLDDREALKAAFNDRMAGPAADPKVVWIVRLIFLECMKRNAGKPADQIVRPEVLMLQWLIDDGHDDLVRLIACMPYWPIGLDADGNWC